MEKNKAAESEEKKEKAISVHITNNNQFQKGVGAFITNLNHLTLVMDEDGNMKIDMNKIPIMPHTEIDQETNSKDGSKEELFHFIHPEVGEEERWEIHKAIERLVKSHRIPEICAYLKELKGKKKILLPTTSDTVYDELVRLGMPTGEGFSKRHFQNKYIK